MTDCKAAGGRGEGSKKSEQAAAPEHRWVAECMAAYIIHQNRTTDLTTASTHTALVCAHHTPAWALTTGSTHTALVRIHHTAGSLGEVVEQRAGGGAHGGLQARGGQGEGHRGACMQVTWVAGSQAAQAAC